ncbi:MAG TPA: helix-turn-helix domain-containing protein [Puia sp.]|nr:helix-turn-helix domain-containing protein [Puia sp.]
MKHITIVVPDGYADLGSITGSFDILMRADELWRKVGNKSKLDIHIAGFMTELKLDVGCFSIRPENIRDITITDLVIIPSVGDYFNETVEKNAPLIKWIMEQSKYGAEIASICTGAFLLAATGLLDGKECSTHWHAEVDFRRQFPKIKLRTDKLLTAAGGIYTNGGSYSFLNLILLLVEIYFDRQTAIVCSKMYQIDMNRSMQSPFIIFQTQKNHGDELVCQAQTYIEENLAEKISFEDLASRLAISRRNFDRRFVKAVGNTPVEYLQRVKVEVAKSSLENGRKSIFEVMMEVGYSDDKAFREVFKRITGLSPLEYRARFTKKTLPA